MKKETEELYTKLANSKVEVLGETKDSYDGLISSKEGSWCVVHSSGLPVAVAWTDWETGAGVLPIRQSAVARTIRDFFELAKELDIPAGWAYTSLEGFVNRSVPALELSLGESTSGKLSEALSLSDKSEPTTAEEDTDEEPDED